MSKVYCEIKEIQASAEEGRNGREAHRFVVHAVVDCYPVIFGKVIRKDFWATRGIEVSLEFLPSKWEVVRETKTFEAYRYRNNKVGLRERLIVKH